MKVNCKFYANTFFNKVNLPSSPAVILESGEFTPKFEEEIYIVQSRYLAYIRINKPFTEVYDIDYVVLENHDIMWWLYFYTVENIQMLNENTCELTLMLDPFNSIGGMNEGDQYCQEIPVFMNAQRIHVSDDEFGKYTLPEDFVPNEPLQIELSNKIGQNTPSPYNLFLTTLFINLYKNPEADSLLPETQTENQEVLLIPKTEPTPCITDFQIGGVSTNNALGCVCLITENSMKLVEKLRQYGIENSILASYSVPTEYVSAISPITEYGVICYKKISGINKIYNASGITVMQPAVNKKCSIGQFNKIILASNCSGEQVEANIEEVSDGSPIQIRIVADVRNDGRPTASFAKYKKFENAEYQMQAVNGLKWANMPINFTEKSGSTIERLNLKTSQEYKKENVERQAMGSIMQAGVGVVGAVGSFMAGDVAGGAKGIANAVSSGLNAYNIMEDYKRQTAMETEIFERNLTYQQPQINFPLSGSVRDAYGNSFYIIKYKLSANDLRQYDNYLTQFGYNVGNKLITKADLYSREHYNYVKLNQVHLSTANTPIFIREQLEALLKNGVRLWHCKPRAEYMQAGGNNPR